MNKQAKGMSDRTSDIILVAICAVVLLIVAYPLYYVVVASFSDPYDVYAGKTFLLPSGFSLDGYKAVFADPKIMPGFFNSVKYTVMIEGGSSTEQAGMIEGGFAELNKLTEMIKFSSMIVAALPMLIAYPFVQKYFEKGFMAGAVKG